MSNEDSSELREFRQSVASFAARALPRDIKRKVMLNIELEKADYVCWQKILREGGWTPGHWPKEFGGSDWTRVQRAIFEEEIYRAGAPWLIPFGLIYVGPVIYTFGSDQQKRDHLPGILNSDIWWCQGYSEPGAGSDLSALSTRAVRTGDCYIVNGVKIWTTMAQWADMMFALVRTSDHPHKGISFLLIDMNSPGIDVRPIAGLCPGLHLNEVRLDNVEVPITNLVGEEGEGWTHAKFLLGNERLVVADVGKAKRQLDQLWAMAASRTDTPDHRTHSLRMRIAYIEAQSFGLESLLAEMLEEVDQQGDNPTVEASMLKILGSEISQKISSAMLDALECQGLPGFVGDETRDHDIGPGIVKAYLHSRAESIYGGSNEIQRNILAKSWLGMATK